MIGRIQIIWNRWENGRECRWVPDGCLPGVASKFTEPGAGVPEFVLDFLRSVDGLPEDIRGCLFG